MPHIRFRGCQFEEMKTVSKELTAELATILETVSDDFTYEFIDSRYVFDGVENSNKYPFIEVLWFERNHLKDSVATVITEKFSKYNYDYVTVYFMDLKPENYYENGDHF